MSERYVTDERDRFSLYRLCECPECRGSGKQDDTVTATFVAGQHVKSEMARCPECRGEGRIRQEVATAGSPEAVGVALVTLAREGEWTDCAFGLLDREGEKGKKWLVLPWTAYTPRHVTEAARMLARSKKIVQ